MSFIENLKEGIRNHFDKKKEDREMMEKMQREIDFQKKEIFQEEFKKNALEVAKSQAKKQAAQMSGLQKLRATNRARNLQKNQIAPGSIFSKFSEYTQKNLANRESNIKRTEELRSTAKKMREEDMTKRSKQRNTISPQIQRKPFGSSGFR